MKEKVIFIISIILVVLGISYLGYTAYRFFTRDTVSNGNGQNGQQQATDTSSLKITNPSNQEIILESPSIGTDIVVKSTVQNESDQMVATSFEGRAYKIDEIFTFPNIDTELPVDSKTVNITLNENETKEFEYVFTPNSCGIFYLALADQNYWTNGRGLITYGYVDVNCDSTGSQEGSEVVPGQDSSTSLGQAGGDGGSNVQGTTDGELTPVENNNTQSGLVEISNTTKGGTTEEELNELPKSGPTEVLLSLGILSILSAFAYRLKAVRI